jgi:hypothetical protein
MSLLSITYQDVGGSKGTFSCEVRDDLAEDSAEILTLCQEFRDLSQAQVTEIKLSKPVALPAVNPVAAGEGIGDRIRDQAVLQLKRSDGTGFLSVSVPAPQPAIFYASGPYMGQMVDPTNALMLAWIAAAIAADPDEIITTPQQGAVTFSKGWRKGQPHS